MPGVAYGSTCVARITSHRVAPTPNLASRMLLGTARSASWVVMITIGRTMSAIVRPPASRLLLDRARPGAAEQLDEDRQTEDAVHDRRDSREVADVRVDEPREPRVLAYSSM